MSLPKCQPKFESKACGNHVDYASQAKKCFYEFKGKACGYTGSHPHGNTSECRKTFGWCQALGNSHNFPGVPASVCRFCGAKIGYFHALNCPARSHLEANFDEYVKKYSEGGFIKASEGHNFKINGRGPELVMFDDLKKQSTSKLNERSKKEMFKETVQEIYQSFISNAEGYYFGEEVIWSCLLVRKIYDQVGAPSCQHCKQRQAEYHKEDCPSAFVQYTYRGVSVCSRDDEPDAKEGKVQAYRYALRALKGREMLRVISDPRAAGTILQTDCGFTRHIESDCRMTFQEQRQLYGKRFIPCAIGFKKRVPTPRDLRFKTGAMWADRASLPPKQKKAA